MSPERPRPDALLSLARERFGLRAFRPGQRDLIDAVLRGQDALGLMPTGAGKSLTYQLPALMLRRPVLVVSPLIALMQDQHDKLAALGITHVTLNSALRSQEEREALERVSEGEAALIYVTPERLESPECIELLQRCGVSLFVVDEAHCVSTWGHDFRPAYLALRDARRQLGNPPLLALTATATPEMIEDMLKQLSARDPLIVQLGVERATLKLEVMRTPRADQKREQLASLLREEAGAGIIYVATIKQATELQTWLATQGLEAGLYHGKLSASDRERAQHRFMEGELRLMVATNAFGMGIDKRDLRFVVHYNFPDSLETYYQEAGRAGRDGAPARAVLLYRIEDKRLQSYFLGGKYPRRAESLRLLELLAAEHAPQGSTVAALAKAADLPERRAKVILAQLENAGLVAKRRARVVALREVESEAELNELLDAYEERRKSDVERLELMMRYAETARCRTLFLNEYFGEQSADVCQHCDNCLAARDPAPQVTPARRRRARAAEKQQLERLVASAVGNVDPARVS